MRRLPKCVTHEIASQSIARSVVCTSGRRLSRISNSDALDIVVGIDVKEVALPISVVNGRYQRLRGFGFEFGIQSARGGIKYFRV